MHSDSYLFEIAAEMLRQKIAKVTGEVVGREIKSLELPSSLICDAK